MSFYTAREVDFTINGKNIFCNSISLTQQADLITPLQEGERMSTRNLSNSPKRNEISISYYLTGKCPLKDYIFTNHSYSLTGRLNTNVQFNFGYLQSYQLSARPNEPILIAAQILIADEVSGTFSPITPSSPPNNVSFFNYNDSSFSDASLNIVGFDWSFRNTVEPIYFQKDTGLSIINPDRIAIGEKEISASITCDSEDFVLGFTGNLYNLDFTCRHPSQNITEIYSVSGFINKKDFTISTENTSQSVYSITQSHLNEEPKIASVDTSTYPSNNYIKILSPNLTNGYFSANNSYLLVERVTLGDRDLRFNVARGASIDTITGYIPNDAINGTLSVYTTKGLMVYPSQIILNFSGIGVSGFYPITGGDHGFVLITGKNFYRISDVKFNNKSCNFRVVDVTGSYHKINAYAPTNADIGKISVYSFLRNVSGFSTGNFYPTMDISQFTPTGTWSGICVISGKNFTGITNVYFNKIKSPSFVVNNNEQITARTPITGAGFPKGYITVSGVQGMSAQSHTQYQPILKITGISLISGRPDNDIAISGIFDSGYLYFESGGYRVSFGETYSIFLRSGNTNDFVITGYVPLNSFGRAKPAMVEPDGVTKYTPFTGDFIQVAKPIVDSINGDTQAYSDTLYHQSTIVLIGKNFNYLFSTPYSVIISGNGGGGIEPYSSNVITTYTDIVANNDGTQMLVKNIRMTGRAFEEHVFAKLGVVNYAGTGWFPGYLQFSNQIAPTIPILATNFQEALLWTYDGDYDYPIIDFPADVALSNTPYIISNALKVFSSTARFGAISADYYVFSSSGWIDYIFDPVVNIGGIHIKQTPSIIPANDEVVVSVLGDSVGYKSLTVPGESYVLANTGILEFYTTGENSLVRSFQTGIIFDQDEATYNVTMSFSNSQLQTGIKKLRLYRNDNPVVNRYLAFDRIRFFG